MEKISMTLMAMALVLMMVGQVLATGKGYRASVPIEGQTQGKPQTICPVRGGIIDKNNYVDYKGQRIYFCSKGCDEEFKKNPEKYLEKLKSQGVTLEKSPAEAGKSGK